MLVTMCSVHVAGRWCTYSRLPLPVPSFCSWWFSSASPLDSDSAGVDTAEVDSAAVAVDSAVDSDTGGVDTEVDTGAADTVEVDTGGVGTAEAGADTDATTARFDGDVSLPGVSWPCGMGRATVYQQPVSL